MNVVTRFMFGLLGGGTGYRFNPVPSIVYLRDRQAWLGSVRRALDANPPTVVVPAHGDPVRDDVAQRSRAVLA